MLRLALSRGYRRLAARSGLRVTWARDIGVWWGPKNRRKSGRPHTRGRQPTWFLQEMFGRG